MEDVLHLDHSRPDRSLSSEEFVKEYTDCHDQDGRRIALRLLDDEIDNYKRTAQYKCARRTAEDTTLGDM